MVIFLLSLLLITHASQKAVKLDRENRDDLNKEGETDALGELLAVVAILL